MPIVGKRLHVLAMEKSGQRKQVAWEITRTSPKAKPTLRPVPDDDQYLDEGAFFYLVPVMRAMGIPDPAFVASQDSR